jgi:hypothetical protein
LRPQCIRAAKPWLRPHKEEEEEEEEEKEESLRFFISD